MAGISNPYLSQIERGLRAPSEEVLRAIAESLNVSADLLRGDHAHVNLIPLNPTPGWPAVGSPPRRVRAFRDRLRSRRVNATVRRNRGTDIDAACGQLAAGAAVPVPVPVPVAAPSAPGR